MPGSYPEWPSGEQVQAYFAGYAAEFGVDRLCRLDTEVGARVPRQGGWSVTSRPRGAPRSSTETYDVVVIANGVFCEPLVRTSRAGPSSGRRGPAQPGDGVHDVEEARGRDVVVLGYGKTACDVAIAISGVRRKRPCCPADAVEGPQKVRGVVNFKFLLLTRMGESLFRYRTCGDSEKFLHGPGNRDAPAPC